MGDRAWASLTLHQVGGPKEVEALCAFIEEHLSDGFGDQPMTELQVWGDYDASEVSCGLVDEAQALAEQTPNSIWCLYQDGYSGCGEAAYHLPGLGVWRCDEDGGPIFRLDEVRKLLDMKNGAEREALLGEPWLSTTEGLAKWLREVPDDQLPRFPRPTPDEVEEWRDEPKTKIASDVKAGDSIRPIGSTHFRTVLGRERSGERVTIVLEGASHPLNLTANQSVEFE